MMYLFVFGAFILVAAAAAVYIFRHFQRFYVVRKIAGDRRWLSRLIALAPILVMLCFCWIDAVNTILVIVHLLLFWLVCQFIGSLIRRKTGRKDGLYLEGAAAILITAVYFIAGWYYGHHVYETDYRLTTQKDIGMESLRVVQISDSHVGTTFDGDGFAKHLERIQAVRPDIVVVTGDFVDDDTTREDMIKSCEALGKLETAYGVYYVFGNHDKGYFNSRDFDADEMMAELEKNHVTVLQDETVMIGDHIFLVGRKDRSEEQRSPDGRLSVEELTKDLDPSKYIIVLDHQPREFAEEQEAGVDLVLCGHTHGGQMIPVGILGELTGANEKTYGLETRGTTNYIVNSGISDWAIVFKTGAIAEFGVIDITQEQ